MQCTREFMNQNDYSRWLDILHRDASSELIHLQSQLATMQESVSCFQSSMHRMKINDEVLRRIKGSVRDLIDRMEVTRTCFKELGYIPVIMHHACNASGNSQALTPAARYVAVPTIFQPINVSFVPNVNQSNGGYDSPQQSSAVDRSNRDGRAYAQRTAQFSAAPVPSRPAIVKHIGYGSAAQEVPTTIAENANGGLNYFVAEESFESQFSPPSYASSEPVPTTGNSNVQPKDAVFLNAHPVVDAVPHAQNAGMPSQHSVSHPANEYVDSAYVSTQTPEAPLDHTLNLSTGTELQLVPEQSPAEAHSSKTLEPPHDQACGYSSVQADAQLVDFQHAEEVQDGPLEYSVEGVTSSAVTACQVAEEISAYVPDPTSDPVVAPKGYQEAPQYHLDQVNIPSSTSAASQVAEEYSLDLPSAAVSTSEAPKSADHDSYNAVDSVGAVAPQDTTQGSVPVVEGPSLALEYDENGDPYTQPTTGKDPDKGSGLTPTRLSAIAAGQFVEWILADPAGSPRTLPKLTSNLNAQNSAGKYSTARRVAELVPAVVNRDSPNLPSSSTSASEMASHAAKYRSCRESSHSNGSVDGFSSPVPSEATTVRNVAVPSQPCEIDALTESLQQHWSLSDPSAANVIQNPVPCVPKSGMAPSSIELHRLPPLLEYVRALMSYRSKGFLYLQLMEDEEAILKLHAAIAEGANGPSLKFSEVQPGDFVLCLYEDDKRFYRGRLLKAMGEDEFEVHFVDYGNKCVTSVTNMRRLPESARKLGQCAVKCRLPEDLKPRAKDIERKLESISMDTYFMVCFAKTFEERAREAPIFELLDAQTKDGTSILQVPPPLSLESADTKFIVRNLELGALDTAKVDLVIDLKVKKAITELLKGSPSLPCEKGKVKENSLVAYKYQRAKVTKVGPDAQLSLELIDEFQKELENVPLEECSFLPLAAINISPKASCIVRVAKDQDTQLLQELQRNECDIEMTVVGTNVLPLVRFARPADRISSETSLIP